MAGEKLGEFVRRERGAKDIGLRDDGSTKLKHQSAVAIESENLAVRFTPFWPKLRLSMSIGKTGIDTLTQYRRS